MANPASDRIDVSQRLLARAQKGDRRALDELFRRELPRLRHWADGRVPRSLWRQVDADDLVQLTFLRALRRYGSFENRSGPEFQHYLRRILVNLTRDEIRRSLREPATTNTADVAPSNAQSTLSVLLGRVALKRFRRAVTTLPDRSRRAVLARLEGGQSYGEIAELIGAPGAEAARAVVGRAVERVAKEMRRTRTVR